MKKQFYLLTAGLLTVCIAHAQIKKGDILLGGNFNFSISNGKYAVSGYPSKQTVYGLTPSIGKAVSDNLLVGLNLGYNHNKSKNGFPANVQSSDTYGLGVFVRKYKNLGGGFAVFAEGDLGGLYLLSNGYTEGYPKGPADKSYNINLGFYPGIAYFVSRHVQVEMGVQDLAYIEYTHSKSPGGPEDSKSRDFNAGTNLSQLLNNFVVGLKWVL